MFVSNEIKILLLSNELYGEPIRAVEKKLKRRLTLDVVVTIS